MEMNKYKLSSFSDRRGTVIDMVVLHYLSARYTMPNDPYNPQECARILEENKVSYHYMITRKGVSWQFVDESQKAWHAGKSKWKGSTNINSRSIGITLLGMDGRKFTEPQYAAVISLLSDIVKRRKIKEDMIVGHSDVSPGRKIDSGRYMDFLRIYDSVYRPETLKEIPEEGEPIMPEIEPQPTKLTPGKDSLLDLILSFFKKT